MFLYVISDAQEPKGRREILGGGKEYWIVVCISLQVKFSFYIQQQKM